MRKKFLSAILCIVITFTFTVSCFAANTSTETPISSENANLKWSLKLGTSYSDAPSAVTVIGDTLIVMSKKTLYKINTKNGKTLASAEMEGAPNYGTVSVTYANGKLYCPLAGGQIQAFDYKTMESLWVYKDEIGGQAITPITYDNGYIYTGFWKSEDKQANYVCIDTTDENKNDTHEKKSAKWTFKNLGGFYWAGAHIQNDFIVFGSDGGSDGFTNTAHVFSLSKKTGKKIDSLTVTGDVRSSIASDGQRLYFSTKAGYLYSVRLKENGTFDDSTLKKLSLGGSATATPVIFSSRLYIGVQGSDAFDGGYMKVIDTKTLSVIYSAKMNGYPQSAVLVSDYYFKETGKIYVYSTYNSPPGGITVLTDSMEQKSANVVELFIPTADKAQYSISPIAADDNGTLYYKNDSGYIFAIENTQNTPWFLKIIRIIIAFFKSLFN